MFEPESGTAVLSIVSSVVPADDSGVQVVLLEQQVVLQPGGQWAGRQVSAAAVFPDHQSAQVTQ